MAGIDRNTTIIVVCKVSVLGGSALFEVGDLIEVNPAEALTHESPCTCCPAVVTLVSSGIWFDMTQADGSWARSCPKYYQHHTPQVGEKYMELFQ